MAKQQHVLIDGAWEPTGGPPGIDGDQADITAHEAAADPHPVYLKNTEVIPGANMAVASNADGTVTVSAIVDATGAQHAMPYGVYSTNVAELGAANWNVSYSIPFGVNVESSGITHSTTVNPHQFTVPSAGLYHVVISAQVTITASPVRKKMFVWITINGTDVVDATLTTEITNIDQIVPLEALYVMSLQANDIVSFKYAAEDVTVKFISQPATTTPPKPSSPAVVVTINKFSPLAGLDQEAADERYMSITSALATWSMGPDIVASTGGYKWRARSSKTVTLVTATLGTAPGVGESFSITVRKNGTSILSAPIAFSSGVFALNGTLSGIPSLVADDYLDVTISSVVGATAKRLVVTVEMI